MRARSAIFVSLLASAMGLGAVACSSSDSSGEAQGASSKPGTTLDQVMQSILGEMSIGPTLPSDFVQEKAETKQATSWALASAPEWARCNLTEDTLAGDALVGALAACDNGDELPKATFVGGAKVATFNFVVSQLEKIDQGTPAKVLGGAFDTTDEELPRLRKKLFHPFGSIAKVELRVSNDSPYTGVLRKGAVVPGLARFAAGGPETPGGFVPGLGLKLYTSGGESVGLHALNSLSGLDSRNFLGASFSNHLKDPNILLAAVAKTLSGVHATPTRLPVDHLGRRTVDGQVEASPSSPEDITFDPAPEVKAAADDYQTKHADADPRVALAYATKDATPDAPVTLYTVRAGGLDQGGAIVGTLVATSPFIPSKWGDAQFYVRHQRGCKPVEDGAQTNVSPSLCDAK